MRARLFQHEVVQIAERGELSRVQFARERVDHAIGPDAVAAGPDDLCAAVCLLRSKDRIRDRLAAWEESAATTLISSMFGIFSMPGQAIYSASKAAVRAFTEALWTELADSKVKLTCVHPGTIQTAVIRSARMSDTAAKARALEMQQRYGMPSDRAAAKIIRAIERNPRRVLIGTDAYLAAGLKWLFPLGIHRLTTSIYRRFGVGDLTGGAARSQPRPK